MGVTTPRHFLLRGSCSTTCGYVCRGCLSLRRSKVASHLWGSHLRISMSMSTTLLGYVASCILHDRRTKAPRVFRVGAGSSQSRADHVDVPVFDPLHPLEPRDQHHGHQASVVCFFHRYFIGPGQHNVRRVTGGGTARPSLTTSSPSTSGPQYRARKGPATTPAGSFGRACETWVQQRLRLELRPGRITSCHG